MPRNSRKSMSDPNPLYALAGAGDLAVEKIREFSKLASDKIGSLESSDPAVMSDRVQERIEERADAIAVALRRHSSDIRGQAKGLGERAQSLVQSALVQAGDTYETLTVRGKDAVVRIRSSQNGGSRPSRQISRSGGSANSTPRAKSTTTRKRAATKARSNSATKTSTSRTPAASRSRKATRSAADSGTKSATTAKASSGTKSGSSAKPATTAAKPTVTATSATTPPVDAGLATRSPSTSNPATSSPSTSPATTTVATASPTAAGGTQSGSSSTTKKGGSAKPTS
jgi:hypothetical protein